MALDPALMMERLGFDPDGWQRSVLRSESGRILMLCVRQGGKSTTTAVLGLHTAIFEPESLVLLLAPSQRQSSELFQKIKMFYFILGRPVPAEQETATTLALTNGSRIVCLPGSPDTIRCFSSPRLVIIDEAALTQDDLLVAVSPMLGVSRGRLVALSTPMGRRGWFYDTWETGTGWERFRATAKDCPRIPPEFLAEQRQLLGDRWFRQEYMCSFEETIDQVFSTESVLAAFTSSKRPLFEPSEAAPVAPETVSSKAPLFGVGG
jgi:hypothetical protein